MREVSGGQFVHVPWHRSDILSFTNDYPKLREKPVEWYRQTDRFVKLSKCLWEDLNTLLESVVPADLWVECKRAVDWPTSEPERDRVTGAPSVIEFLKTRISPKNIDWQRIDRTVQETKESIHTYYERLLKAFKEYSGKEAIEPKDMLHFVLRFVKGLRPEVGQMINSHLIYWQAKPIDEVLQYAKYCSDETELKHKKLNEKAMVMETKAAQTGVQGALVQPMPQQQRTIMFQPQMRGRGRGMDMTRGPDLGTVVVQNDMQGMKKMLLCHLRGSVGHWKWECPLMVQDSVVQQGGDVSTFQTVKVPKMRGFIPNVQNRGQNFQLMQQVQVPRAQLTQLQPIQQQVPMVTRQQMQIPQASIEQQQMMLTQ
ncbi:hypothetical protein NDU88_003125 [Pleurodeles waltl]|uniref:Retrotransposon gag domain-containing protein n=1 Tax=Pleurodeles waltl TaxID=8319 RepID=A0AAV7VDA2_PLEWA|nr:hypothetical protein NDU88_003125 [Pleurodeles waltl]